MATTLEISGGYTNFLEKLEDRLDDNAFSFPKPVFDSIDGTIDLLQSKVNEDDQLVIGEALGKSFTEAAAKFFPSESIALGIDYLQGEPVPTDFEALNDAVTPLIFGATDGGSGVPDLLGLLPDAFTDAIPDGLFDDLNDLFPGKG